MLISSRNSQHVLYHGHQHIPDHRGESPVSDSSAVCRPISHNSCRDCNRFRRIYQSTPANRGQEGFSGHRQHPLHSRRSDAMERAGEGLQTIWDLIDCRCFSLGWSRTGDKSEPSRARFLGLGGNLLQLEVATFADFSWKNCYKWFFGKRPCGLFYVPKR